MLENIGSTYIENRKEIEIDNMLLFLYIKVVSLSKCLCTSWFHRSRTKEKNISLKVSDSFWYQSESRVRVEFGSLKKEISL